MVTVNVVVLAGTISADPVERRMPSGDELTELRLSVPEAGKRLLPLPVSAWHKAVGKRTLKGITKVTTSSCTAIWSGGSIGAGPEPGASRRWWPLGSRSSNRRRRTSDRQTRGCLDGEHLGTTEIA